MERNFNNREFEQFVKQNADQYRMFPSEKVWDGIDKALHNRRRWYGLGLALLLLLTGGGVTWVMITTPVNKLTQQSQLSQQAPQNQPAAVETATTEQLIIPATPGDVVEGPLVFNAPRTTTRPRNAAAPFQITVLAPVEEIHNRPFSIVSSQPIREEFKMAEKNTVTDKDDRRRDLSQITELPVPQMDLSLYFPVISSIDTEIEKETATEDEKVKTDAPIVATNQDVYPMTIESVVNSYKKPVIKNKIEWQVYIAPTVSYRKLSENKSFLQSAAASGNVPAFAAYNEAKNVVTHKPDIGLELGVAAKYALGRSLKIRAGLQFNVSRYDIKAFTFPGEIATIALDAGAGNNSISQETTYRTRSGSKANWLQNLYYSASLPIGLEMNFNERGKKSTYFGMAGTIQPTYILNDHTYLLSTDYKNYVDVPSLVRHWNVSTSFETFISYSNGNVRWQIGPQVRYQLRSSFENRYPVKENLFDFGLKVGVTLLK
jgi:hypothetical protein